MTAARPLAAPRSRTPAGPAGVHSGLVARSRELAHIDQMLWQARRGRAGVIGLRGECGVGKSALIEAALARATAFRTVQVRGTTSVERAATSDVLGTWPEALRELAVRLDAPAPALARLAGGPGPKPSPPAISAAAVDAATRAFQRMLTEATGPVLVTVDDCHVLPQGLVAVMAHTVLTRLGDQPIGLVLAWRDTPHLAHFQLGVDDVPVHQLGGLTLGQARELLGSRLDQFPAEPVLQELVGRTGGNPLALVDVASHLSPAQLAGWHPLPDPLPVDGTLAEAFDVVRLCSPDTQRALVVAAAGGAPADAMASAMERVGVDLGDLQPAIEAGVVYHRGPRIEFRHPLVRSVAYFRSPHELRREVRRALSDVLAEAQLLEASAHHASIDVAGPDELAARRLVDAARVALDRGEPVAAARYEELAAHCATSPYALVQHLAGAAAHWSAAGEVERAHYCLEAAAKADATPSVAAELRYQMARLHTSSETTAPRQMIDAAEALHADQPTRALGMLVDAAAWQILSDRPADAEATAERAVRLAGAVSTHSEVLARTVRAAAVVGDGGEIDEIGERGHVSLLLGQTERFIASPEVAFVIGQSLLRRGLHHQAQRWSQWIARCAEHMGDVSLAAVPPLLDASMALHAGDVATAAAALEDSPMDTEGLPSAAMGAWGLELTVWINAVAGRYEEGFSAGAHLFAMTDAIAHVARLHALPAVALLELQRGRAGAALAWARSAEYDLGLFGAETQARHATILAVAPFMASIPVLARSPTPHAQWSLARELEGEGVRVPGWVRAWIDGVEEREDPAKAVLRLDQASAALEDHPLLQMVVDLCSGARLVDAGLHADAAERLAAVESRARAGGAHGLAQLAARERRGLPEPPPSPYRAVAPPPPPPDNITVLPLRTTGRAEPPARPLNAGEWEITLLGGFSVRHRAKLVSLPASLATQAIKIVALGPRRSVDELIELLWEEAEPRVGTRRLRNVLWRIRSLCGDLVVRDDNFLRLAKGATTDLEQFRALADQALVGPDAGTPRAVELARQALDLYRGELLPGDRYADWAAAARESATRTHLRLLDLLVDDALAGDRHDEALVLLDRLAEVDPYDERHRLRSAEIYLEAGNRGRALDALEHAERMLADLGVAPSPAIRQLREALDRT